MKKLAYLAAAVALGFGAVGTATADETAVPKTRAVVVAELNAARHSGELTAMVGEDSGSFYLSRQTSRSGLSRGQVRAHVVAPHRSNNLEWMYGEDSGSFVLSGTPAAAATRYAGPNPGDSTGDEPARTASAK